jgi:hypothetical protein
MSENVTNSNSSSSPVSWSTKVGYIGTGVLIGLIAYPFVRKVLGKAQPKWDAVFDSLTGKAENLAEKASDLMAQARERLVKSEDEDDHVHEAPKRKRKKA